MLGVMRAMREHFVVYLIVIPELHLAAVGLNLLRLLLFLQSRNLALVVVHPSLIAVVVAVVVMKFVTVVVVVAVMIAVIVDVVTTAATVVAVVQ